MNFIKLVINELIKNLRKRSTLIFFIFSISAIIVSCLIVKFKDYTYMSKTETGIFNEYSLKLSIDLNQTRKSKADDEDKELYQEIIDLYNDILTKGYENILTASYKNKALSDIVTEIIELTNINKDDFSEIYDEKRDRIEELKYILYNGTFEEYIEFNKKCIEQDYKNNIINFETYEQKIKEQDIYLEYEIDKYTPEDTYWKSSLYYHNQTIDSKIENRMDFQKKLYITDERVAKLKEEKLINIYRLKNDIAPCYTDNQYHYNKIGYMRYHYNSFANYSSMLFIGLLVIILSAGTISEEISKGTIKFLLITPNKRYKVLCAKILSILIILVISTLIISQISVLIGNIAFGVSTNNYLYVNNGEVKVMDTHLYETLQYLLKMPEIIIYILLGIVLSTLTRNTAVSVIICTTFYTIAPFALKILNTFTSTKMLRFLPFTNFDFINQIFPPNISETVINEFAVFEPSLNFSINVISVTAILLIIIIFESFNKKDI